MFLYIFLADIYPPLMFPRDFGTFTHTNPHTASQLTLSQPLLTISYVHVLHLILPCLKVDWVNNTTIPNYCVFLAHSPPLCNFFPVTWQSPPQTLCDFFCWFLYQVLPTQSCATNTGYTKLCFHNEPIKFIIISYTEITILFHKKKQFLKNFFPFNAIANTFGGNSMNTHFAEILNNMVSAYSIFISLLIYTTIAIIFSPSSSIHLIQVIHRTIPTTPTISVIVSKIPFMHLINVAMNWRIWWAVMQY